MIQTPQTQVWKAFDTSEGVEVAWNTLCLDEVPRADKKRILNEIKILEKVREATDHGALHSRSIRGWL